ncbi:hypothetical protein FJY93_02335 [Candidatus Kaiserbacteria bacterium]|nr:hypothetical protein [Candidatus Kaiserbacteria bacterium]
MSVRLQEVLEDLRDRVLESIADDLKMARQLGDDEVWSLIKSLEYSAKREADPYILCNRAITYKSSIYGIISHHCKYEKTKRHFVGHGG